jgi:hypothetical protein
MLVSHICLEEWQKGTILQIDVRGYRERVHNHTIINTSYHSVSVKEREREREFSTSNLIFYLFKIQSCNECFSLHIHRNDSLWNWDYMDCITTLLLFLSLFRTYNKDTDRSNIMCDYKRRFICHYFYVITTRFKLTLLYTMRECKSERERVRWKKISEDINLL